MHTEPIKTSHPEAIALAERLVRIKRERREAARQRWQQGDVNPDALPTSPTFKLSPKHV